MKKFQKPIYLICGDTTVFFGTGRKEFNPKKPRPGLEHYIAEAGKGAVAQLPDPAVVDEGVVGNFMAARFNHQGHLGAMLSLVHPSFAYKPSLRVEGACASGGLAVVTAAKSVLSGQADLALAIGVESPEHGEGDLRGRHPRRGGSLRGRAEERPRVFLPSFRPSRVFV